MGCLTSRLIFEGVRGFKVDDFCCKIENYCVHSVTVTIEGRCFDGLFTSPEIYLLYNENRLSVPEKFKMKLNRQQRKEVLDSVAQKIAAMKWLCMIAPAK